MSDRLRKKLTVANFKPHFLNGGEIWLRENFLSADHANELFTTLQAEISWEQPIVKMGGLRFNSPRLAAWYGDPNAVYSYSGVKYIPHLWNQPLLDLRQLIFEKLDLNFNSVLLNYYRSGSDSMGWHQDNERELGTKPTIFSLSLGESRRFSMKHIKHSDQKWRCLLTHGSALIMLGETQTWWKHCLPKTKRFQSARINLTFRKILPA